MVAVIGAVLLVVPGLLGRRNSARNPRRTAITAAAVMIGIALITAISTLLSSASLSIGKLIDKQIKADLIVSGVQTSEIPPRMEPAAVDQMRALGVINQVSALYVDYGQIGTS